MAPKHISIELLRTLAVAAGGETLTDVARRVGRSQSAISLRLKKLEEELGIALVRRTGRGSELTDAGHLAHSYARQILALNDDLVAAMAGLEIGGNLRLGLPADLAESWLATALAAFTHAYPHVHVEVSVDRNQELIGKVQRGELDVALAITAEPPVGAEQLAQMPIRWIGRPHQSVAGDEAVPLVLFTTPCLFRQAAIETLEERGRRWRLAMTSPSLAGLWAAVEAGLGISIRTPLGLPDGLAPIFPAQLPPINRVVYLSIWLAEGPQSRATQALCEIARDTLRPLHEA
jgi:DNA-binding transcriptional LysR family regulator